MSGTRGENNKTQGKSAQHSSRAYLYPRIASKGYTRSWRIYRKVKDKGTTCRGGGRQCIRCIYVGSLIARKLTVSTGSYLTRQFLLLQSAAIYPARAGSFVAEASYGPGFGG